MDVFFEEPQPTKTKMRNNAQAMPEKRTEEWGIDIVLVDDILKLIENGPRRFWKK